MQAIAPVTSANLLAKGQQPLLKFEIYDCCCWVDLTPYVIANSLSISTAGAEMTPAPVAGDWSISLFNKNGRFDPDEDAYAPRNEYLRVGRKVKISIGATYGGVDYYWRRIYGFMELPDFSIDKSEVYLRGFDNMQFLADTKLRKPNNYWGTTKTFSTVASANTYGVEKYAELDAMEIGAGEANNVNNWTAAGGATKASVVDGAVVGSTWSGEITFDDPPTNDRMFNDNIGSVTAGKEYRVTFYYKCLSGGNTADVNIYETGAGGEIMGGTTCPHSAAWIARTFFFVATKTGTIRMTLENFVGADALEAWRIDEISVMEVTGTDNTRYNMDADCMGPYYATLNGEPVWYGVKDEGWYFDYDNNIFYFDDNKQMEAGTDNLIVYYFTVQVPENIVADLLVIAGLYDNRAEALADMIYTLTGTTINQVWFDAGTTVTDAMRLICVRCNYRFYFNYSGRPVFKPAPIPMGDGLEHFDFTESHITNIRDYEDRNEIRNRIVIKGRHQAQFVERRETMPSELDGEASEVASINKYGEHTWEINNHLFQDQATIDTYCATYLAAFKNPKWYTTFDTPFNPVPLVKGDTARWHKKYEVGGTPIIQRGLIRDIQINEFIVSYRNEKITFFPVNGDLMGYWPFDEGSGMIAYDRSGNENDGTLENMEEEDWVDGKVGKALDFDGEDDYVSVPDDESLKFGSDDFTIVAWIKPGGVDTYRGIITKYYEWALPQLLFTIWNTNKLYFRINDDVNSPTTIIGSTSLDDNWHFVVAMRRAGKLHLFLNAVSDATPVTDVTGDISNNYILRIGHRLVTDYPFTGLIDEPRIYKRALTANEIEALYKGE